MFCLTTSHVAYCTFHLQVGEGKSQVDEVVEHFNICAGNPAVCMTQVCRLLQAFIASALCMVMHGDRIATAAYLPTENQMQNLTCILTATLHFMNFCLP